MEDEILNIMLSKDDWDQDKASTAKEIAKLFKEFIEWCIKETYNQYSTNNYGILDLEDSVFTLDDLFDYWIQNVKQK